METGEQSEMASGSPANKGLSAEDEQVCLEADSLESIGKKAMLDILADLPTSTLEIDELDNLGNGLCTNIPYQKEALILESGREELNRNESITSSVSDTLSSADSVYENEYLRKRQDTQEQEQIEDLEPSPENGEDSEDINTKEPVPQDALTETNSSDVTEESMLEQYIREDALSDISNESCHGLDQDDVDECLRVEIAVASSDSEGDDRWRAIFSSSINKEDDDSYLDNLELSAQELFVQKVEVEDIDNHTINNEVEVEIPKEEEVLEQPDDIMDYQVNARDVTYNPLTIQGLSKVSEDEDENGKGSTYNTHPHSHHDTAEPNKKLPMDFCVIQETKSENVSMEHVDFQMTRKQWLEMEEQNKNQVLSPTSKQGTLQGSHSFMYTPVRNIDRSKRDPDLESLALGGGEYPHTQFSPCSEDSGLDDSSYRSPYDDPETTIEKEIRLAMEREEIFRRQRGFSKMAKSNQEDSCKLPRSPSTPLTPSFIITSSPLKGPLKHEMATTNITILEPDNYPVSPRHGAKDTLTSRTNEWHSDESSNVIILETSNLIIRSASEFCLNKSCEQTQESTFLNNPFFKLRSRSTLSLVDEEIKMVKQREEELKRQRANVYTKDGYNTVLVSPNLMDSLSFDNSADAPVKCKSSPSSPMKTPYKMDRSTLSCDHRFSEVYTGGRRKSALALRWEAGEFANND